MIRRDGHPILIGSGQDIMLARVDLQSGGAAYDEAWLQRLLHVCPRVFPIGQIEPGFSDLVPVCRELPLAFGAGRTGNLDNVYVTAEGGIVLVEAKLWRNPEARRKVVAQAMDYAAAVFASGYEGFEAACRKARVAAGEPDMSLAQLVRQTGATGFDEAAFIDALSLALRRGRAIVAVVGDGIREDVEAIAGLLQSHAGDRFRFALVELGIFAMPDGLGHVVVPSVLAKTTLIERGVVRIEESASQAGPRIVVATPTATAAASRPARVGSLTEDAFLDGVDARDPVLGQHLREFLAMADECGFWPEVKATLNIKHDSGEPNPFNLGYISQSLYVEAGPASWFGRLEHGRRYLQRLADLTGGVVSDSKAGTDCTLRTADGRMPRLSDLLPRHRDAWLAAMTDYVAAQANRED